MDAGAAAAGGLPCVRRVCAYCCESQAPARPAPRAMSTMSAMGQAERLTGASWMGALWRRCLRRRRAVGTYSMTSVWGESGASRLAHLQQYLALARLPAPQLGQNRVFMVGALGLCA